MTADQVAKIIVDGIENRSRTLVLTMQGRLTVLLSKILPAFLDKMVYNVFAKEKNPLLR
jgi:short-subunit dehydrogenase